jgi:hypothetical protein
MNNWQTYSNKKNNHVDVHAHNKSRAKRGRYKVKNARKEERKKENIDGEEKSI